MWKLHPAHAILQSEPLTAHINIQNPLRGLSEITAFRQSLPHGTPLCLDLDGASPDEIRVVLESYSRGQDLIVAYGPQGDHPVTSTVLWHIMSKTDKAAGLEVVISLQTDQLYQPAIARTYTEVSCEEIHLWSPDYNWSCPMDTERATAVLACVDDRISYLEIAHPTNRTRFSIQREAESFRWDFTLLEQVLEKGVIHRARLQGWWLATENAQQLADQLIAAFSNSPLPLTT